MRTFNYREAAILIGGTQSKLVTALDKVTGGIMLGTVTVVSDVLSWFDAKADFVKLSHDLVNAVIEKKRGIRRIDRTRRIEAAHTVIVMTAFFESFAEFDLPFSIKEVTAADQRHIQEKASTATLAPIGRWLLDEELLPTPDRPFETNLSVIGLRYDAMARSLNEFITQLAVWDEITEVAREKFNGQLKALPDKARRKYEVMFRTLVTEFPEVACWANMTDHAATRAEVMALGASLAGLEAMLAQMVSGSPPDDRRAALKRAYQANLADPILPSGEASHLFALPSVERAHVNPRFRVCPVRSDSRPSKESWWTELPVRDDIQQYFVAHLTSSQGALAPLVVLGQPGAGKSMLTKVLAARLPATDFLPIRVELRNVAAEDDVQDQIEQAIRQATGERVEWTDLARSAGDAIPVVLLDGFDELLQATSTHQIDYLTRISKFQEREANQGRAVAVIVTTRIAVAEFVRFPASSVALRLEPFDETQVTQWINTWNSANHAYFTAASLSPLEVTSVLRYPELATQPLLLLMLALHDADMNALQVTEGAISESELYERLLVQFVRREVTKAQDGTDEELNRAVEHELRRLSYVAFAMFNRNAQWVTHEALTSDLRALFWESDGQPVSSSGRHRPLTEGEITLGRFFFIHRASAQQAGNTLETFEFLHATFAEYLVARMAWQLVRAMVAQESAVSGFFDRAPVDDSLLRALLSFVPLSARTPTVRFLLTSAERLSADDREKTGDLLIRLLQTVHDRRLGRGRDGYEPRRVSVLHQHASYSANLVVLTVAALGEVKVSRLYGAAEDAIGRWQSDALLWRSQIDYYSILNILNLRRIWDEQDRDIIITVDLGLGGYNTSVVLDWTFPAQPARDGNRFNSTFYDDSLLLRRQLFFASVGDDILAHAVEPLVYNLAQALTTYSNEGIFRQSAAHLLLELLVTSDGDEEDVELREQMYRSCVDVVDSFDSVFRETYAELIIRRMCTDRTISAQFVHEVFEKIDLMIVPSALAASCLIQFFGQDSEADLLLMETMRRLLLYAENNLGLSEPEIEIEVNLGLVEMGYDPMGDWDESRWRGALLGLRGQRPDLVRRVEWMLSHISH